MIGLSVLKQATLPPIILHGIDRAQYVEGLDGNPLDNAGNDRTTIISFQQFSDKYRLNRPGILGR